MLDVNTVGSQERMFANAILDISVMVINVQWRTSLSSPTATVSTVCVITMPSVCTTDKHNATVAAATEDTKATEKHASGLIVAVTPAFVIRTHDVRDKVSSTCAPARMVTKATASNVQLLV